MEKCAGRGLDRNEGSDIIGSSNGFTSIFTGWNSFSKKAFHHISFFCGHFCNPRSTGTFAATSYTMAENKTPGQYCCRRKRTSIIPGQQYASFYRTGITNTTG